jgi:hypothetical protein
LILKLEGIAMNFHKYNDIENSYNKFLEKFMSSSLYVQNDIWTITEKVHGCLDENTIIQTSIGNKTVKQICEEYPNINYQIRSYNIETQAIEYVDCTNISVQDNIDNWLLITLEDNTNLVVTSNHKIYLPEYFCYRNADQLHVGDVVLVTEK